MKIVYLNKKNDEMFVNIVYNLCELMKINKNFTEFNKNDNDNDDGIRNGNYRIHRRFN